jgi:hypothetical protein
MATFECKQEYTFTIQAATENEAMTVLEKFHQEEDKIVYGCGSQIKVARSTVFSVYAR